MNELAATILIAQGAGAIPSILGWSIGLVFLVLLLLATVVWLRKRLSPTRDGGPIGFSLSDLRALRQKGDISQEEFERAKAKVLQAFKPGETSVGKPGKSQQGNGPAPPPSRERRPRP